MHHSLLHCGSVNCIIGAFSPHRLLERVQVVFLRRRWKRRLFETGKAVVTLRSRSVVHIEENAILSLHVRRPILRRHHHHLSIEQLVGVALRIIPLPWWIDLASRRLGGCDCPGGRCVRLHWIWWDCHWAQCRNRRRMHPRKGRRPIEAHSLLGQGHIDCQIHGRTLISLTTLRLESGHILLPVAFLAKVLLKDGISELVTQR